MLLRSILFLSFLLFFSACQYDSTQEEVQFTTFSPSQKSALFAYSSDDSLFITRHFSDSLGMLLTKANWKNRYIAVRNIEFSDTRYLLRVEDDSPSHWYIQKLYKSGDIGFVTDSGEWNEKYSTLVVMKKGEKRFIFRQSKSDNRWFVNEITSEGKMLAHSDSDTWNHFYDAITPLHVRDGSCFFAQTKEEDKHTVVMSDGYHWTLQCVNSNGKLVKYDSGNWEHFYATLVAYEDNAKSYLFRQRSKLFADDPWYIHHITTDAKLGNHTDSGSWNEYYEQSISYNNDNKTYLLSHNKDKKYLIHHLSGGHILSRTSSGTFKHYYDSLDIFKLDPNSLALSHWMGEMSSLLLNRKLAQIALPGSHDAGLNEADRHNCYYGAASCNTVTQSANIKFQLEKGSRFFDIRPALSSQDSGKSWSTAHTGEKYSYILGCQGESRSSIINGLNDFFSKEENSNELVILKISHCTPPPGGTVGKCNEDQLNALAENLSDSINDTVTCKDCKLREMTLAQILQKGNVILLFDEKVTRNRKKGIFRWGTGSNRDLYFYDHYSNSEDFETMRDDQVKKLLDEKNHSTNKQFLLSWTLTFDAASATACLLNSSSILKQAMKANPYLYREIHRLHTSDKLSKKLFPNIIYVDAFEGEATRTAIYLNKIYTTLKE